MNVKDIFTVISSNFAQNIFTEECHRKDRELDRLKCELSI